MFKFIHAIMLLIYFLLAGLTAARAQAPVYKFYSPSRVLLSGNLSPDSRRTEVRITKGDLNKIVSQAELIVKRRLEIIEPSILSSGKYISP